MYIASSEGINESARLKQNTKPTVLVQAGIHAGEIDGKDAGMMLLRDIIKGDKAPCWIKTNLLFVPMFSVDAHERSGEFNRVNQRGPVNMGWRTTANNLNLNRDYARGRYLRNAAHAARNQRVAARLVYRRACHRRHRLPIRCHLWL